MGTKMTKIENEILTTEPHETGCILLVEYNQRHNRGLYYIGK